MAQVFNVDQLACQVIDLLAEQQLPMFVAEDVLIRANYYLKNQKVSSTDTSGKSDELLQKATDQLEQLAKTLDEIHKTRLEVTNKESMELRNELASYFDSISDS